MLQTPGRRIDELTLAAMTDSLAHRGPDDRGSYIDGPVGLGHRRLAIIDLSRAGHQPMASADGDAVITYNGEVYNFQELRKELEQLGYRFRSRTDTEVVLNAFRAWGPECVERLNGMYAFAIWDRRSQELFLARDRHGVKPLYYTWLDGSFAFASEIKAFLEHPAFAVEVSRPHLVEYFTFQNIFSDGTLFSGVKLLPAGHWMLIRPGQVPRIHEYWDFTFREDETERSAEEWVELLRDAFEVAVRRQLVSDAPVGSYLSSGIDSGSITAVAARQIPHLLTFTGGFDLTSVSGLELAFDERRQAEAVSYACGTEHYEVVLKSGDMERCLSDLVWHLEDPRVGQSYPNYFVARLASRFVKVVLGGTGGDELFGGYPWRYFAAEPFPREDFLQRYYRRWHRLVDPPLASHLFHPEVYEGLEHSAIDALRGVLESWPTKPRTPADHINRNLYFEAKTFLHGLLLVEDKLSMAHGLESRVPFLDNDLVELAMTVPVALKIGDLGRFARVNASGTRGQDGLRKTREGKLVLREAMRAYVPEQTFDQVKQGFSGPDATWFRGDSIRFVQRLFFDDGALVFEYLRPEAVRDLLDQHSSGRHNHRLLIWSLLMFELWLRRFQPDRASRASTRPAVFASPDVGV